MCFISLSDSTGTNFNTPQNITRKFQDNWDLPKFVFEVPSTKVKLEQAASFVLTQERSKIFKKVSAAMRFILSAANTLCF